MSCYVICQIVSLQYLSTRSSLRHLAGLRSLSFFCHLLWSLRGDTRGPPFVSEAFDVICTGPLHLSYIADYVYYMDFCPVSDPDVNPSVFV